MTSAQNPTMQSVAGQLAINDSRCGARSVGIGPTDGVSRDNPQRTDADIAMDRYAAGDDAAFGAVYDALAPRVFAYLRRNLRDTAHAEDLLQQTLLHIHRARGTFLSGAAVLPWAFAIARRLLIDELRRHKRTASVIAETHADDDTRHSLDVAADHLLEARDLARRLQHELARLPASQRTAFELLRLDGLSHAEAAEVLGVTVNAVKLRAHRAYLALRSVLGDGVGESTRFAARG
jgi:RNA polymerase sigma-70 factor (ECF subfamily)